MERKLNWKLYWVELDGYYDSFVIAKSKRSAESYLANDCFSLPKYCEATLITIIPEEIAFDTYNRTQEILKVRNTLRSDDRFQVCPDYVEDWLLLELGFEKRICNGNREYLYNDIVYSFGSDGVSVYSVGARVLVEMLEGCPIKYEDIDCSDEASIENCYSWIGQAMHKIHLIEGYFSHSFIFAINDKNKKKDETIGDVINKYKKLTFGQILGVIEESYEMSDDIKEPFGLFLKMRNLLVHGITEEDRYNINTE